FFSLSCSDSELLAPGHGGAPGTAERLFVQIDPETDSIAYGDSRSYSAKVVNQLSRPKTATITWSSSNPDVIAVAASGTAVAVGAGTAQLIASIPEHADTVTITVYGMVPSLAVAPEVVSMPEGDSLQLEADYGEIVGANPDFIS